jgi:signal transduction histidine kinase
MVPLLLVAPESARPILMIRALHTVAHRPGPIVLWNMRASDDVAVDGTTVIVLLDDVTVAEAPLIEAHLDEPGAWMVGVCRDPARLPASVLARFRAAVLRIPPLAERLGDVPALAAAVLERLVIRGGKPVSSLTPGAVQALCAHAWPGGRVELETVLAHAVLLVGAGGPIDAPLLDFAPALAPTPALPPAIPSLTGPRLEYLLAELAHELRNPLVTVKTFAQQLPALLDDAALRTRFADLTDDAVARMDALLENVLDFARLRTPRPEDVDVGLVLDGVLGAVTSELAEREVHVRRVGTGGHCSADREHLQYALSNLLVGIARETPPRAEVLIDASVNGIVSLRFGTGAAISRLRDLTAATPGAALDDPTFLPLAFTLARAVLERSGGHLGVTPDLGGQATVTVRLPPAGPPSDVG